MRARFLALSVFSLAACSNPPPSSSLDSAVEASTDARSEVADSAPDAPPCTETIPIHSLYPGPLFLTAGTTATVALRLPRDRGICDGDYALVSEAPTILGAPASVHIARRQGYVEFTVQAGVAGTTVLHVSQQAPAPSAATTAQINVTVFAATPPACPTGTNATGNLAPGMQVKGTAGTPLTSASVSMPATVTDANPVAVTIACAPDQVPAGYDAVGPAVSFTPGIQVFSREIPMTVPINPGLVPAMYELQTEVSYTAPGFALPRIVAMANTRFSLDGTALSFDAPRLGTYQAVVRHGLGTHHVQRHFTWRAILGVSMGGLGSSMIAMRHPELFDFVAPLGGPANWEWYADYFRRWVFGGFCTAAQRASGTMDCSSASNDRTPPLEDFFVVKQNFEWFNYPDGRMGQGGTFDRDSYTDIFRDLGHLFGNPLIQSDPENGILPQGVPTAQLTATNEDRCANPITLHNYYDDEYNPDGSLPVITFCDGNNVSGHAGEFMPGQGRNPFEIGLAVDLNSNGIRDPGEPVIRNASEPFRDFGADGLADESELAFDPVTNPDPNGDDYNRQYNPAGTERNNVYDLGEPFDDVGLDGLANTPQVGTGGYDLGENNNLFDTTAGAAQLYAHSARNLYNHLSAADAHRLGIFADGGTRDLLNFGADSDQFSGVVSERGESLHLFSNFSALVTGVAINPNSDDPSSIAPGYNVNDVDYTRLPLHSMLRYGFLDATEDQLVAGDGGHVGTVPQFQNRIETALAWIQGHWPGGDHAIARASFNVDDAGRCANGNQCSFDFESVHAHRTASVSMYLPPGYHENPTETYPVVFVLHGYGQQPSDLLPAAFLLGSQMVNTGLAGWRRPAKYIIVFPDGRCHPGDGCVEGNFFSDSVVPNNAQAETFFLDLYDYVAANYRARPASDVDTVE